MMNGKQLPLSGIAARTAVVHAVTYFTWGQIPLKSKVGLGGLAEVLSQSFLLSAITCHWVNHPEKRWLTWVLGVAFAVVLILPALGLLASRASL
jgi:hypothetical protein